MKEKVVEHLKETEEEYYFRGFLTSSFMLASIGNF